MGSLTFDFLTESFLFSEDLIAEQFASIPDHDLEQELQRYRAFCISNEKSLLSEVRSHPSNLRVFSGLDRVSLDQLKQSALYVEQYVIDDPLVLLTARNSDLGEAMNKLLGMQARSTDKAALTDKIRFLKRITPMVAAGFVKLLPVSVLFDPPRETPIFTPIIIRDALPAEVLRLFRDHALVKSVRRAGKVWRVEDELFPCRAIYIEFQGHPNVHGEFCTYHDNVVKLDEEDRTVQLRSRGPTARLRQNGSRMGETVSQSGGTRPVHSNVGELMLAGSIGALYCTRSELLAGVLKMQIRPTDSIPVHTTNTVMNLELPLLTDVQIDQLMRVRTEEGEAFHNFRTELDKQLRYLRTIDDPEQAAEKLKTRCTN